MPANIQMLERHFTVRELAEKWGIDYSTALCYFRDEPGVIRPPRASTRERRDPGRKKRSYGIVRVPESVAAHVYERMMVKAY